MFLIVFRYENSFMKVRNEFNEEHYSWDKLLIFQKNIF